MEEWPWAGVQHAGAAAREEVLVSAAGLADVVAVVARLLLLLVLLLEVGLGWQLRVVALFCHYLLVLLCDAIATGIGRWRSPQKQQQQQKRG